MAHRAALGTVAASVALVGLPTLAQAAPSITPFISEIHYDNANPDANGADVDEFVEIELPPGTSTDGLSLVRYNGGTATAGAVYAAPGTDAIPLVTAPGDGRAVAVVEYPLNGLQNGERDGLALLRGSEVLEFISYEGVMTAANGPAAGRISTDIGVAESGSTPIGHSVAKIYNTATGGYAWTGPAAASKGTPNGSFTPPPPSNPCAVPTTHDIGDVQGSGAATPLAGEQVTVRGTVVGDVPGINGFYLQDSGDGDDTTSDGVFVFSSVAVGLGDTVAVKGAASEFGSSSTDSRSQTQISSRTDVEVCDDLGEADLPEPAPLDLPADDAARERLEGMLVRPDANLVVSEVFQLVGGFTGGFGELMLSADSVLVQPTEVARPGTQAAADVVTDNARRRIVLDDGSNARTSAVNRPYLTAANPVRVGDRLTFAAPTVLGYGFSNWRLQPADGDPSGTFTPQNTRPAVPDAVGGDVQIGAFNVLNYFISFGAESRGAPNQAELEEQAGKIVPAIRGLGADVVTLMEIEDTDSTGHTPDDADGALADLVDRLNTAEGSDVWSYVPLPQELYAVDRDVIRSAIIYRNDVVQPVGASVGLAEPEPQAVWDNAREPIAQTFVKDGDAFTVVSNHFKSKSAGASTGDNADARDGQGQWNGDRRRQAASLAAFADELRAGPGGDDVVLMGDFNAYTQEDPIVDLAKAGYADLGEKYDAGRYSYVFDALSGSLDHALASSALQAKVTGLSHWNINAVESSAYQYDGDPALYAANQYRSSDHDPLVLGINLDERCQGLVPTITGTNGDDVLTGTDGIDVIMGLGGNDVINGLQAADVLCGGAGNDTVNGGLGDDVLLGGFGDDTLKGENGDDTLIGGPGTDVLIQGRGTGTSTDDGVES